MEISEKSQSRNDRREQQQYYVNCSIDKNQKTILATAKNRTCEFINVEKHKPGIRMVEMQR